MSASFYYNILQYQSILDMNVHHTYCVVWEVPPTFQNRRQVYDRENAEKTLTIHSFKLFEDILAITLKYNSGHASVSPRIAGLCAGRRDEWPAP